MNSIELEKLIQKIIGLKLESVRYACEMLMFDFAQYALHVQCLTRIIKNGDILVSTHDYFSWDGEHGDNNDEYYNLKRYRTIIEGGVVLSAEVNSLCDLMIVLDNGVTIQVLIENGYAHYDEEQEQYRFFEDSDDEAKEQKNLSPHYVVYSKHIEIHN